MYTHTCTTKRAGFATTASRPAWGCQTQGSASVSQSAPHRAREPWCLCSVGARVNLCGEPSELSSDGRDPQTDAVITRNVCGTHRFLETLLRSSTWWGSSSSLSSLPACPAPVAGSRGECVGVERAATASDVHSVSYCVHV